ncbi:MAG: hypothetical protein IPG81_06710 [Sandaracinaceae bacterium]|nr:hypothetical protein [Sandaracinaceae bacterium]
MEQHAGRARFLRAEAPPRSAARRWSTPPRCGTCSSGPGPCGSSGSKPRATHGSRAKSGDGLDAARIVLPEAHAHARTLLPGVAVAVIPHRDTILFAPHEDHAALERYARELMARAPHPISARALRLPRA